MLDQLKIRYAQSPQALTVIGDDADTVRGLTAVPLTSILPNGQLSADDPAARQMLANIVEGTLTPAIKPGEICCVILPGDSYTNHTEDNDELDLCSRLVEMQGYDIRILSSSMAVLLASAEATSFTGVGISLGANSCTISLARMGVEIAYCHLQTGGDWIDESLAKSESKLIYDQDGSCYLNTEAVREWREALTVSIADAVEPEQRLLREHYEVLIDRIINKIAQPFKAAYDKFQMTEPLNFYVGGGLAQVPDLNRLMTRLIQTDHNFPLPVGSIRVMQDDGFLACRGGLINAEIETAMVDRKAAA